MFDDEKIKLIEAVPEADMILVIWIKLLTLAGKKNMNGYIFLTENIPYTDEMLATIFMRPLNTIRLALETFKNFGMINYNGDGQMKITNWEKHQNVEGLERIRELGRKRQAKYMERKNQMALNDTDVSKRHNDGSREEKIREDKKENNKDINKIQINDFQHLLKNPINNLGKKLKKSNNIEFDFELYSWHGIDDDIKDRWAKILPNVDVEIELNKMREYFKKHPDHEKIIKDKFNNNYAVYIYDWLVRAEKYIKEKEGKV